MEGELEITFFKTCAPVFFSEEFKKILSRSDLEETTTRTEFLRAIDTLVSLLTSHHILLRSVLPLTIQDLITQDFAGINLV